VFRSLTKTEIVSNEREPLILVDTRDREIGFLDKSACHDGAGVLHRAFSLFIFNPTGELLLQRRASNKRLWPSFWSNSCCSHPRRGETMDEAVQRRMGQELGLHTPVNFVYKFEYQARFGSLGTEHELCSVYIGQTSQQPMINTTEIDEWRWISPADLDAELAASQHRFTPWFKMEWQRLRGEFADRLTPMREAVAKNQTAESPDPKTIDPTEKTE
jgi:isopentenyl-diphosphate delta-isomerase